jgi:hypothetical protein
MAYSNKGTGPMKSVAVGCVPTPGPNATDFEGAIHLKGDLDWKMVIGFGESDGPPVLLQELDPKG